MYKIVLFCCFRDYEELVKCLEGAFIHKVNLKCGVQPKSQRYVNRGNRGMPTGPRGLRMEATKMSILAFQKSLSISYCCYKGDNTLQQKSIVAITESSDHNRMTSMSSLKKWLKLQNAIWEKLLKKQIFWSDGNGAHFKSWFVFKLLASLLKEAKSK